MKNTKNLNKITFNFETMKFEGITIEQVKFWENAYPDVDVVGIILRKSPAWLDTKLEDNPNQAHKKRWKTFLNNWFAGDQAKYDQFKKERA
jgi:hypothetical protein